MSYIKNLPTLIIKSVIQKSILADLRHAAIMQIEKELQADMDRIGFEFLF